MHTLLIRVTALGAAILAALALSAYAYAATTTRAAPATRAAAAAAVPACSTASLAVWAAASQSQGAAGTIYYPLQFTNVGAHSCTLRGYPGVSALSQAGSQLGNPAAWGSVANAPVVTVTLAPGGTAHAVLAYSDAQVGSTSSTAYAAGLRVYPPGQYQPSYAFWSLKGITVTGQTYLRVSPVEPGVGTISNI